MRHWVDTQVNKAKQFHLWLVGVLREEETPTVFPLIFQKLSE